MWKHVAAHALRKTAPLRLKLYIARDKRTMIRLQSSLLFIYTATHLYVPAYSPLVFFVFCLVLFLTSFEEKKSAKRRFFLSLALLALLSLCSSLPPGFKKKQKSLSSLYPSFTTNARRNKERETNAREQSSANASPRWKSAAERAERNARRRRFSTLFLVFFFRERKERPWWGEKKTENFFGKRGKGKNKVEKRVLGRKRERTEGKKMWVGGSIDRSKKKKIWPDNWIEQFELAS